MQSFDAARAHMHGYFDGVEAAQVDMLVPAVCLARLGRCMVY